MYVSTNVLISGLSHVCIDDKLRRAITLFGRVVLAQVLKDGHGHSLGLGTVRMGRAEDVERVCSEHQRFEVGPASIFGTNRVGASPSRVDDGI